MDNRGLLAGSSAQVRSLHVLPGMAPVVLNEEPLAFPEAAGEELLTAFVDARTTVAATAGTLEVVPKAESSAADFGEEVAPEGVHAPTARANTAAAATPKLRDLAKLPT